MSSATAGVCDRLAFNLERFAFCDRLAFCDCLAESLRFHTVRRRTSRHKDLKFSIVFYTPSTLNRYDDYDNARPKHQGHDGTYIAASTPGEYCIIATKAVKAFSVS